jgi:hypothetical protein
MYYPKRLLMRVENQILPGMVGMVIILKHYLGYQKPMIVGRSRNEKNL